MSVVKNHVSCHVVWTDALLRKEQVISDAIVKMHGVTVVNVINKLIDSASLQAERSNLSGRLLRANALAMTTYLYCIVISNRYFPL